MAAEHQLYFLPTARAELVESATRYEVVRQGLGTRFIASINVALATILASPERWPLAPHVAARRGVRRYLLKRFPFAIFYRVIGGNDLEVVAVAHQKRRPQYWSKRLP